MAEILLPPWIVPEQETHEWLDEGSSVFSAAFAPGIAQRQSYGGLRLKLSRRHTVRGEEKAQLLSILQATRGRFNALRTKVHFALRGSGFGSELLTNNTFANGVTGWSGTGLSISVTDRVLRSQNSMSGASTLYPASAATLTQYATYCLRVMLVAGRASGSPLCSIRMGTTQGGSDIATESANSGTLGMRTLAFVPNVTSGYMGLARSSAAGPMAGDYLQIPYVSLSRGPSVDNGINLLLQSDEFDTSWTATRTTVDDDATTAPNGSSGADSIIEDSSAANTHFVAQNATVPSAAADFSFTVAVKAGARTWAQITLQEATGGTFAFVYVNLSTGALGTVTNGANWSNGRAFSIDLGNGWYQVSIVASKTNSATSVGGRIGLATGDGGSTYTGNGTSNIYAWRGTLVQSSVPTRLVATTTTDSTGTSQTGNALYVKGLPASTNGLLLAGDWVEINGELKQCSAPLNSGAAGLGYLQFDPPLVRSPADNDPIIVTDPMGKFLVSNIQIDNEFGTQAVVTYDLEHIYE